MGVFPEAIHGPSEGKGGVKAYTQRSIKKNFFFDKTTLLSLLKKIGGAALQAQTKRIGKKDRSVLVFFEYSSSHHNHTSV